MKARPVKPIVMVTRLRTSLRPDRRPRRASDHRPWSATTAAMVVLGYDATTPVGMDRDADDGRRPCGAGLKAPFC